MRRRCRTRHSKIDLIYHESIHKKRWAEPVITAAWIINRIPSSENVTSSDVTSIAIARRQDVTKHDVTPDGAVITPYADNSMITRSRARHIDETTDPTDGGASKKQVVVPSEFVPSVKKLIKHVERLMMSNLPLKAEC
ncbi:unnamed protein product [Phytophthora fragariaefolia]|uniref:Unnamed protein product n=1 Tax=Phytophthora fragariaefolia TaxID=1490495 RepID=A0A9W6WXG7_9STRA|nr:unnamed protein product [Phytophthora fragariaefolia]